MKPDPSSQSACRWWLAAPCASLRGAAGSSRFWWRLIAVYVVVLYATLPLGRPVITWLRAHFSTSQQIVLTYCLFGVVAGAAAVWLVLHWRQFLLRAWIAGVVLAGVYCYEFKTIVTYPEERLHFLEYGVLAFMLYKAFSFHGRGVWPYLAALVAGSLIGWGDEGVQWLTQFIPDIARLFGCTVHPLKFRRYYALSDVVLNVKGIAYGLLVLALVFRNRRMPVRAA